MLGVDAGAGLPRASDASAVFSQIRCRGRNACERCATFGGLMPAAGWALFILRLLGTVYLLHFQSRVVIQYVQY